jgi:hypothetical protein
MLFATSGAYPVYDGVKWPGREATSHHLNDIIKSESTDTSLLGLPFLCRVN